MKLMVQYGLSPMQAIVAATKNAAENMDSLNLVGTIKVGKLADLILWKGDPSKDISVMDTVSFVAKDGIIYRDDISDGIPTKNALPRFIYQS